MGACRDPCLTGEGLAVSILVNALYKWPIRKHVRLSEDQRWKDSPSARLRFGTGGRVREDLADLRVVTTDGDEVPHAVVARGPGDAVEIVWPVAGKTEWFVYHGNPEAKPQRKSYTPERGLVLETRTRGAGSPVNWSAMEQILARSTTLYGGATWGRVYDAMNPFGPSDNFVSEYRGFIRIPKAGKWIFYTASDEASFLFVAGRLVTECPGWHAAGKGAWATFKGKVKNRSNGRSRISKTVKIRGRRKREIHQSDWLVSILNPGRMDVTSNRANPVTIQTRT